MKDARRTAGREGRRGQGCGEEGDQDERERRREDQTHEEEGDTATRRSARREVTMGRLQERETGRPGSTFARRLEVPEVRPPPEPPALPAAAEARSPAKARTRTRRMSARIGLQWPRGLPFGAARPA